MHEHTISKVAGSLQPGTLPLLANVCHTRKIYFGRDPHRASRQDPNWATAWARADTRQCAASQFRGERSLPDAFECLGWRGHSEMEGEARIGHRPHCHHSRRHVQIYHDAPTRRRLSRAAVQPFEHSTSLTCAFPEPISCLEAASTVIRHCCPVILGSISSCACNVP